MKKRILFVALALMPLISFTDCANAGIFKKPDVFISYDQLGTDAAYKQFAKASKMNQLEILTNLVDQAEKEYLSCTTEDGLEEVRENLETIKFWINSNGAEQNFISITRRVRTLDRKIVETLAEIKGQQIILNRSATSTRYSSRGQELN